MNTTAGESRTNTKLTKELKTQAAEIGKLKTRLNELIDNIAVLENDVGKFKKNVSKDILDVIEALKENATRT